MKRCRLYKAMTTCVVAVAMVCGCTKGDYVESQSGSSDECYITFGASVEVAATRVTVSESANSDGTYPVTFDQFDKIGVYLYYNNYFYYYDDYKVYAESVIFANEKLEIDGNGSPCYLEPLRSWTFSTLYGTAPYKYDAIAYYPYTKGYKDENEETSEDNQNQNKATKWSHPYSEIFVYEYDVEDFASHCDFMVGTATYQDVGSIPESFRSYILSNNSIALKFTRQMASVNFCVTKADELVDNIIIIDSLTVHFSAFDTFEYNQDDNKIKWKDSASDSDTQTADYEITVGGDDLVASVAELATTTANSGGDTALDPDELDGTGVTISDELLTKHLYFPPDTYISKIVFYIDGGDTCTFHPHVATIVANTHYSINMELDPSRSY